MHTSRKVNIKLDLDEREAKKLVDWLECAIHFKEGAIRRVKEADIKESHKEDIKEIREFIKELHDNLPGGR